MTPAAVSRALALATAVFAFAVPGSVSAAQLVAPTSLAASASSSSSIGLTWVEVNSTETGHSIERSGNPSSGFVVVGSTGKSVVAFQDAGLVAGTVYYYRVRATGRRGELSPYSAVATATTIPAGPTAPVAPSGLSASAASATQINLLWTDNSGNETGFKVERGSASTGPWTQIGTTGGSSYADAGLAGGTTYFYRVRAYNAVGDSGYSNVASGTTTASATPPAVPGSLSASPLSSSQIRLAWVDGSSNETGFKIERSTATSGWTQVGTAGSNATAFTDAALSASTAYSYRVRAFNTAGDSGYSNAASATTPAPSASGAHLWSDGFGGLSASASAVALGVGVDDLGDVVIAGYLMGSVDVGSGLLTSAGGVDMFVAKYSASGTPLWSKRMGGTSDERAKAVGVDGSGNVYVTGIFRGTVDFGGGPITASTGAANAFLVKYSPAGVHLWSKRLSTSVSLDEGTALAVDGAGNVVVGGILYQTSDFGGGPLTSAGGADIFLVKYSASGAHVWSRRIGGAAEEWIYGLAVNGSGGPALIGSSAGSVDLGGGVVAGAGGKDVIVAQYSSTGTHVWSRRVGGSLDDVGRGIAVDDAGYVVVTGNFASASVNFGAGALSNSGGADIFLARYDSAGAAQWSKRFGTSLSVAENAFAVATDGGNNVLLTGSIVDTADFGGGPLPGDGYYDIFQAKFDSGGGHVWSRRTGAGEGTAIAADGQGNAIAVGDFSGATTVNFGGSNLVSPGGTDTFIVKFGP